MTRAIVLHQNDNVATLIKSGAAGDTVELVGTGSGSVKLDTDLPYGHKLAISKITLGDDILKLGRVIGRATADIDVGKHVHVHNVESLRARGDLK